MPVQFLLAVVAARLLGPTAYGVLTVLLSIQALLYISSSFGFDELTQREVARSPSALRVVLAKALRFRLVVGVCVILAGILFSLILGTIPRASSLAVPVALVAITVAMNLVSAIFTSVSLAVYRVTIPFTASLLSWSLPLLLAASGFVYDVQSYVLAVLIGSAARLGVVLAWAVVREKHASSLLSAIRIGSLQLVGTIGAHTAVLIHAINNQVLARHGDIMVATILGIALPLIGSYALAYQITTAASSFLMIGLGAIGLSRLSHHSQDKQKLGSEWRRLFGMSALLSAGPIAVLMLIAEDISTLLFDDEYPLLTIMIIGLSLAQWANRLGGGGTNIGALLALGESPSVARTSIVGALTSLSLSLILLPLIGVLGLVVSTAVSLFAIGAYNTITVVRIVEVKPPFLILLLLTAIVFVSSIVSVSSPSILRWLFAILILSGWGISILRVAKRSRA